MFSGICHFVNNSGRVSNITPTLVSLQKYKSLIQKYNKKRWILFFSWDLRFFLFFINWIKLQKKFPPLAISFYTTGGCFFFVNVDTKVIWSFFKREFNNFWLRLAKEKKVLDFFEKKPEHMINMSILIWEVTGKGICLGMLIYLCFHSVYNYSYNQAALFDPPNAFWVTAALTKRCYFIPPYPMLREKSGSVSE